MYPYRNANHNCTPNAKPSLTLTLTLTRNPNNPQLYCEDGTEEDPAAAEKESKKAKKKKERADGKAANPTTRTMSLTLTSNTEVDPRIKLTNS